MSKKLKKKIAEITGLNGLEWADRQERATKILASPEWKQRLCNELVGLSFKELENFLTGVATERQKKEDSYERKLEAYRSGKASRRPKAPGKGETLAHSKHKSSSTGDGKGRSRTLKEILAQVHAPRMVQGMELQVKPTYLNLRGTEPSDEVFQDSSDEYDCSEERLG